MTTSGDRKHHPGDARTTWHEQRVARGLTQDQLAERSGIHKPVISNIENRLGVAEYWQARALVFALEDDTQGDTQPVL